MFRTEDGGDNWQRQSNLDPRPFYFSQIRVDPEDDKKVYVLGFMLHVSEDAGKTWREDRLKNVHSDCHALAIDPRTPERLLLGTDGGVYASYDRGAHWDHRATMAIGEFYRIAIETALPSASAAACRTISIGSAPAPPPPRTGSSTRTGSTSRGATDSTARSTPRTRTRIRRIAVRLRSPPQPGEWREQATPAGTGRGPDRIPVPLEFTVRAKSERSEGHVPGGQPRLQADRSW